MSLSITIYKVHSNHCRQYVPFQKGISHYAEHKNRRLQSRNMSVDIRFRSQVKQDLYTVLPCVLHS